MHHYTQLMLTRFSRTTKTDKSRLSGIHYNFDFNRKHVKNHKEHWAALPRPSFLVSSFPELNFYSSLNRQSPDIRCKATVPQRYPPVPMVARAWFLCPVSRDEPSTGETLRHTSLSSCWYRTAQRKLHVSS